MCWKYEDLYPRCFDFMFMNIDDDDIITYLREIWDIVIVDQDAFEDKVYDFLTDLQENNIIRSATKEESEKKKEKEMDEQCWYECGYFYLDEIVKRKKSNG